MISNGQENELLDVKNPSSIELNHKDLPTYHSGDRSEVSKITDKHVENLQADVRSQIEYTVLCDNYSEGLANEVVEIITGTLCLDGPGIKIGCTVFPTAAVRKRMRSLTCEHVSYTLDSLGKVGPIHNPHRYLLVLLLNAPASCSTAVQAICNANS